jgi:hypothetical protein
VKGFLHTDAGLSFRHQQPGREDRMDQVTNKRISRRHFVFHAQRWWLWNRRKGYAVTCTRFPVLIVIVLVVLAKGGGAQENDHKEARKDEPFQFELRGYDAKTLRKNPTTQIAITIKEWSGNTFLLWLPEAVPPIWNQWTAAVAHQDFRDNESGGLVWSYTKKNLAHLSAELQPKARSLVCTVRVKNLSAQVLDNVCAQNCLHFSKAPGFVCDDFSRILIRTEGQWKTLKDLQPTCGLPMYYRPGFLESEKIDMWRGRFRRTNQPSRADHPLIICLDKEEQRAVATASADYQCVFHNRDSKYLRCIHSQQAPVSSLPPGEAAIFRQWIFFVEGGVSECLRHFNQSEAVSFHKVDEGANKAIAPDARADVRR